MMETKHLSFFTIAFTLVLVIVCLPSTVTPPTPVQTTQTGEGPLPINVDSCGADPYDLDPDSDAIQQCINKTRSGDTVTFTSGIHSTDYQGYIIDKTIFLVAPSVKSDLTFTSTDPEDHALLRANSDLMGFVMRLYARSQITNRGSIDNVTVTHLDFDGGRDVRRCFGEDGREDGVDDNWGSWLPECTEAGDSWCVAGTLAMQGGFVWEDFSQDYQSHPSDWSTGLTVTNVTISNTECGTALTLNGAEGMIRNVRIFTAGDHVHASGCAQTENDEWLMEDWSDGITFLGPGNLIQNNTVVNASDVGIVFFGGKDTIIVRNIVRVEEGNYGAFAGIAIHPWIYGDVSGVEVIDNQVISEGSPTCGGFHAGINIGQHMWGRGCIEHSHESTVGNPGTCLPDPPPPEGTRCNPDGSYGAACQEWAYVAEDATFTLRDNYVSGAHINYLIEGLDLMGAFDFSGNTSGPPQASDWECATWAPADRVAHHPALDGWLDLTIHCTR